MDSFAESPGSEQSALSQTKHQIKYLTVGDNARKNQAGNFQYAYRLEPWGLRPAGSKRDRLLAPPGLSIPWHQQGDWHSRAFSSVNARARGWPLGLDTSARAWET